jgi:hypothetical protein
MMEAVRTSETSVNFNVTTRRYIPEESKLHSLSHTQVLNDMSLRQVQSVWDLLWTKWHWDRFCPSFWFSPVYLFTVALHVHTSPGR